VLFICFNQVILLIRYLVEEPNCRLELFHFYSIYDSYGDRHLVCRKVSKEVTTVDGAFRPCDIGLYVSYFIPATDGLGYLIFTSKILMMFLFRGVGEAIFTFLYFYSFELPVPNGLAYL